jgi:DNA polymerase III delta prime subunit
MNIVLQKYFRSMKKIIPILILIAFQKVDAQTIVDCSTCTVQQITAGQIKDLSIDDLRFLTNDLFAREGFKFGATDIDFFYSAKNWYKAKKSNSEVVFNEIEKKNIKLFQDRTTLLKAERKIMMDQLEKLKALALSNNSSELLSRYRYNKTESDFGYLQKSLAKIDMNDINWFKHKGMYELTIDNGNNVMLYSIIIENKKITIKYNSEGGSRIAENATLYPDDYNNEFTYWWIFEFENTLKYIKFDMAG